MNPKLKKHNFFKRVAIFFDRYHTDDNDEPTFIIQYLNYLTNNKRKSQIYLKKNDAALCLFPMRCLLF